jgi:hypothetical protein
MISIKEPNREFEIPFKKNKEGNYIVFPKHIGGKNSLRTLHAKKYNEAYVYILRIKNTDTYKIGVSTNPQRRFRDIASMIPYELELLALNKIKNAFNYEQELLNKYEGNLIKNEWFEFPIDTVKDIMILLHNRQVDESR